MSTVRKPISHFVLFVIRRSPKIASNKSLGCVAICFELIKSINHSNLSSHPCNPFCRLQISVSTPGWVGQLPRAFGAADDDDKRQIFKKKFITFRARRKINFMGRKGAGGCRCVGVGSVLHKFRPPASGHSDILHRNLILLSLEDEFLCRKHSSTMKSCLGAFRLSAGSTVLPSQWRRLFRHWEAHTIVADDTAEDDNDEQMRRTFQFPPLGPLYHLTWASAPLP